MTTVSIGKAVASWQPALYSDQGPENQTVKKVGRIASYFYAGVLTLLTSTVLGSSKRFFAHYPTVYLITLLVGMVLSIALTTYEFFRVKHAFHIWRGLQKECVPHNVFNALAQDPSTVIRLASAVDFSKTRSDRGLTLLETVLGKDQNEPPLAADSLRAHTFHHLCSLSKLTATDFLLTLQRSSQLATFALQRNRVDLDAFTEEQKAQCREYAVTPELRKALILHRILNPEEPVQ